MNNFTISTEFLESQGVVTLSQNKKKVISFSIFEEDVDIFYKGMHDDFTHQQNYCESLIIDEVGYYYYPGADASYNVFINSKNLIFTESGSHSRDPKCNLFNLHIVITKKLRREILSLCKKLKKT